MNFKPRNNRTRAFERSTTSVRAASMRLRKASAVAPSANAQGMFGSGSGNGGWLHSGEGIA